MTQMPYPQFIHYGGADGVTGSCHRLQMDAEHSLLVDCGLFQGQDAAERGAGAYQGEHRAYPTRKDAGNSGAQSLHLTELDPQLTVDFPVDDIQALVVTHVHIDHIGRLPYLLAAGFDGPIICSKPSAELLPLVLEDALKIGFTRNRVLIERFQRLLHERLLPLDYTCWHTLVDRAGLVARIKLHRAGHILGSCFVEVALNYPSPEVILAQDKDGANTRVERRTGVERRTRVEKRTRIQKRKLPLSEARRVIFSGDLGAPYAPLLAAPKSPYKADYLVLESTCGDRLHGHRQQRSQGLKRAVEQALMQRGTLIIPAFSIGRTQELLYELEELVHQGGDEWQALDVIVDSPLAARFTEVYRRLKPYWDKEAQRRLRQGRLPLGFDNIYTVDSHEMHETTVDYLARKPRPAVVIAASGMCTGGRVVNYLKAMLGEARHQVLFVGYQARGTEGYQIQKYGPRGGWVELDGQRIDIKARIHTISGYSAHGDQNDLVNFVKRMRHWPKQVRLVHGDRSARWALKHSLEQLARKKRRALDVVLPDNAVSRVNLKGVEQEV